MLSIQNRHISENERTKKKNAEEKVDKQKSKSKQNLNFINFIYIFQKLFYDWNAFRFHMHVAETEIINYFFSEKFQVCLQIRLLIII